MNNVFKSLLVSACLLLATSSFATSEDWKFELDKKRHFGVGAITGFVGYTACGRWCGYGAALTTEIGKEIYDEHVHPQWYHTSDIAYHMLGAVVGVELGNIIITPKRIIYQIQF